MDVKTLGTFKPVYVIVPPETEKEAKPYDLKVLQDSYAQLPENGVLHERDIQQKINAVFPVIEMPEIEEHAIFKKTGEWVINKLTHRPTSYLLERLEIDSVSCIVEDDEQRYLASNSEERMRMEIPVRYWSVQKFNQLREGNKPFVVPDSAYTEETGLNLDTLKTAKSDIKSQIL